MSLRAHYRAGVIEAGCDEAGRGCLAGPVVAAAVVLPAGVRLPGLDDSKRLTEARRDALAPLIRERSIAWSVGEAAPEEIDRLNILQASFLAMHRAIDGLRSPPELLLIDGNRFRCYGSVPHVCVVKGDGIYRSIAAASILAKTHRDALMTRLHRDHPEFGWEVNKGYPTIGHREAIRLHGPTIWHRHSFRLVPEQPPLF
ncbi:MAG: ribonuclease HII [Flavobacteriales bacterium]|nr:ribonuclease HII [Flavobacteriales bacterium]